MRHILLFNMSRQIFWFIFQLHQQKVESAFLNPERTKKWGKTTVSVSIWHNDLSKEQD